MSLIEYCLVHYGGAVVGVVIGITLLYFVRRSEYRAFLRGMERYLREDHIAHTARSILNDMKPYLRADADHESLFLVILNELIEHHDWAKTYVGDEPRWWGGFG